MKKLMVLLCFIGLSSVANAGLVTNGLVAHLDAGSITGLNTGDNVTTWADITTDAFDFTANAVAGYGTPTFVADAGDGYAAVKFERVGSTDAERQFLDTGQVVLGATPAAVTQFVVATGGPDSGTQRSMQFGRANGGDRYQLAFEMNSGTSGVRANGGAYLVTPAPFDTGEWIVASAQIGEGVAYANLNYTVNGTYYAPTGGTLTTTARFHNKDSLIVGCGETLNGGYIDQYDGMVAEVLVYDRQLSTAEIAEVNEYLMDKYAIPEPATLLLLGLGTLAGLRRRK